jgi:PAS domain S-box-containing protein
MGVAQDITAQKLAEEELRWKTAFLEAQVNSSIDGILVVDRHGKKILQNQRLNELWKIPRHIADDPDDKNQLQWVASMTKNPEEFIEKVEYLYSHPEEISRDERELKDGTTLDRYSSPVIGKDGEYYGRIWTFRDITERKQVEATLQRQQAELRVLFDLIPAMIWFKDAKDRILRLNKRAAEIAGKTVEQIEGKPTIEIHPQDATKFYADDLEVIRSGVPKMGIVETLRNSEGEVLWIQTDRVPYCGTDGSVIGIVVVAQDITERKRAEESLRLLGTAVKQSKESIVITDSQLDLPGPRILFVNPAFTSMTGYTAAEVLGKTPRILQGPHTDKAVLRRLRGTLTRGEPFLGETINYRKDGTEYYVELHVTPIRDASGVTTHFVALQRDITERKLAEVKVATLAHAVESTDELICITDLQDHFIFVNRAFQKAYGYTEAEILGKTPEVLFSPRNPSSLIAEVFAQARLGGWRGEVLDRRKDGTDFPIRLSTSLVKARNGQVIGLMGVAQDITEHKLAVETLQESQQQLKNILDNTTAAIHMKDLAGRYILVNRYFESKFHVRREEIVGKTDSDLFTREQATAFQQNDLHVLAASAPLEFEEVAPHADGLHTYISIKFPLFDTQGVPYAVCGISTDITERKRLEKEIWEISDREQARIGHDLHDDLCQRLVSIAFDSNLLEKKLRKKSLVEAADANNIAHLLDESITQARTLARVLYPVKLESDGLAAALKELAISVSNRPTLHCDVDCPGPVPIGDIAIATHLYRIAQEAVSNAARHAQASRIVIGLQMRDGEITLSVTDNGIGLPDDVNQRRGMGLHTMQYRARLIDGRLAIKRAESGGTSVTCRVQVRSL